jgi:hypothetical protein
MGNKKPIREQKTPYEVNKTSYEVKAKTPTHEVKNSD